MDLSRSRVPPSRGTSIGAGVWRLIAASPKDTVSLRDVGVMKKRIEMYSYKRKALQRISFALFGNNGQNNSCLNAN